MKHAPLAIALALAAACAPLGPPGHRVIHYDPGGIVAAYVAQAGRDAGKPVAFTGDCFSACTLYADRMRASACVTPQARMHIHKGRTPDGRRISVPYSAPMSSWIDANGGQPENGWLTMRHPQTLAFWAPCPGSK